MGQITYIIIILIMQNLFTTFLSITSWYSSFFHHIPPSFCDCQFYFVQFSWFLPCLSVSLAHDWYCHSQQKLLKVSLCFQHFYNSILLCFYSFLAFGISNFLQLLGWMIEWIWPIIFVWSVLYSVIHNEEFGWCNFQCVEVIVSGHSVCSDISCLCISDVIIIFMSLFTILRSSFHVVHCHSELWYENYCRHIHLIVESLQLSWSIIISLYLL